MTLRIIATWSDGTLSAVPPEYALMPPYRAGDILVAMSPEREILFDMHGEDLGYLETCLGPVEVTELIGDGVVPRPVWEGVTLDRMMGAEVRQVGAGVGPLPSP